MSDKQILVNNLNFSFNNDNLILKDISFSVKKGKFLSVVGASGSGKSTLLRIISSILPALKTDFLNGSVFVFEEETKEYLKTGKLSFMFQEASLMPNQTVRDNIIFPLKLRGNKIDNTFIDDLLKIVGLYEHQFKYPTELSGGMKTRTSLARAFVTKPELLLLDEPFSALDISWRYDLYQYLKKVSLKYNTTVILVTHNIQESIILGDDIIVLSQKGNVLDDFQPIKKNVFSENGSYSNNIIIKDNVEILLEIQKIILDDSVRNEKCNN